jgi:hypothetical protein
MSKVINPLMSFGASGQLGQKGEGIVFKTWRGKKFVVLPPPEHNLSNTLSQQTIRGYFKQAVNAWHAETGSVKTAWNNYANSNGMVQTGFNLYIGKYVSFLIDNSGTTPTSTSTPPTIS